MKWNKNMNPSIVINGKLFNWDEILNGSYPTNLESYQKSILEFCNHFISGQQEFKLTTSGSTGIPKVMTVKAELLKKSAQMTAKAIGLQTGMKALVCLNTDFIAGKMMLVRGLEIGMDLYITPPSSNPFQTLPENLSFDFLALVPFQAETILKNHFNQKTLLDKMKAILIGGAAISFELEELLQHVKAPIYHTFGMTETLSHIALRKMNGIDKEDYFTILEGVSISKDDRNCLVIQSPFTDGPIITNDVVELIDDKRFKWLGRADFLINSGGIKIHPEIIEKEIERIFYQLKLPNRFFITGTKDPKLGETVSMVIESKPWDISLMEKFKEQLSARLAKYSLPKHYFFLAKFEETGSSKIDRRKSIQKLPL
jgi:O-succinylbenzoic acid--CoA ligase